MENTGNKKSHKMPHTFVYGVSGLTEWQAVINVGKASIRIPFTGGMLSGYGCTPALFKTSSPTIAKIIENSLYFKNRRIKRLI